MDLQRALMQKHKVIGDLRRDEQFGWVEKQHPLKIQICEITRSPPLQPPKKDILEPYGCDFLLAIDA